MIRWEFGVHVHQVATSYFFFSYFFSFFSLLSLRLVLAKFQTHTEISALKNKNIDALNF